MTEHVVELAGEGYVFEERGKIAVKGLGMVGTFFLLERR